MVPQPAQQSCTVVEVSAPVKSSTASLPSKGPGLPAATRSNRRQSGVKPWGPKPAAPNAVGGSIKQLMDMGFAEGQARQALTECVWDVNKALDLLMERAAAGATVSEDVRVSAASASAVTATAELGSSGAQSSSDDESPKKLSVDGEEHELLRNSEFSTTAENTESEVSSPRSSGQTELNEPSLNCLQAATAPLHADATTSQDVELIMPQTAAAEKAAPVDDLGTPPTSPVLGAVADEVAPAVSLGIEETAAASPLVAPQKRVLRTVCAWAPGDTQFSFEESDFVRVWPDSQTEHGWLYAESLLDAREAGWIPSYALEQPLPSHQRWMNVRKSMQALHETQLSVLEDNMLKVSVDTLTGPEGWVYAEAQSTDDSAAQTGWVPVYCLEWHEE